MYIKKKYIYIYIYVHTNNNIRGKAKDNWKNDDAITCNTNHHTLTQIRTVLFKRMMPKLLTYLNLTNGSSNCCRLPLTLPSLQTLLRSMNIKENQMKTIKIHVLALIANVQAFLHPPQLSKPLGTVPNAIYAIHDGNQYARKEVGGRGGAYKWCFCFCGMQNCSQSLTNAYKHTPQNVYNGVLFATTNVTNPQTTTERFSTILCSCSGTAQWAPTSNRKRKKWNPDSARRFLSLVCTLFCRLFLWFEHKGSDGIYLGVECIYIYIYIERERKRERGRQR